MKRIALLGLVVTLTMSVGGCLTRAAKEVFLSPSGFSVPTAMSGSQQNSYLRVRFQNFTNTEIATMPADMNQIQKSVLDATITALKPKKAVIELIRKNCKMPPTPE
jgi:hypothetical protein